MLRFAFGFDAKSAAAAAAADDADKGAEVDATSEERSGKGR